MSPNMHFVCIAIGFLRNRWGKGINFCCLLIFVLIGTSMAFGQQPGLKQAQAAIYTGFVKNEASKWEQGLQELNQLHTANPKNKQILYGLAHAKYGMIGFLLARENETRAKALIKELESHLDALLDIDPQHAETHALIGGLYGIRIGLSPAKGIYLGPKSLSHLEKAIKYGSDRPITWVENGNAKFHSPALFGGSNAKAIAYFSKAIELFDSQTEQRKNNWMYLHALAWLGQAHVKNEDYQRATDTYKKALAFEPGFIWVKEELLPHVASLKEN